MKKNLAWLWVATFGALAGVTGATGCASNSTDQPTSHARDGLHDGETSRCAAILCGPGTVCDPHGSDAGATCRAVLTCASLQCAQGTSCDEHGGVSDATCAPVTNACAARLCPENTRCVEVGADTECVPF